MAQSPYTPSSVREVLGLVQVLLELNGKVSRNLVTIVLSPYPEADTAVAQAALRARMMVNDQPVRTVKDFEEVLRGFEFQSDTPGWWYHTNPKWFRYWRKKLKSKSPE